MVGGVISAAAMCASGLAGAVMPDSVGVAMELPPSTGRGRTEIRAGLGGTYAALGAWALADRSPASSYAIGFTWLGAAAARLASLAADRPRTNASYWLYLAAEIGLGTAAVADARKATR
jgi:hypothetical protein